MKITTQKSTPRSLKQPPAPTSVALSGEPKDSFTSEAVPLAAGVVGAGLGYLAGSSSGLMPGAAGFAVGLGVGVAAAAGMVRNAEKTSHANPLTGIFALGAAVGSVMIGTRLGGFESGTKLALGLAGLGALGAFGTAQLFQKTLSCLTLTVSSHRLQPVNMPCDPTHIFIEGHPLSSW